MSTRNSQHDEAELEAFLARESPVSIDYDNLELVEPTAELDATILAAATAAVRPVAKPAPARSVPPVPKPSAPIVAPVRRPPPVEDDDDDDGDTVAMPASRRPRWMLPVALAASLLAAVGIGVAVLDLSPTVTKARSGLGALFAKRARERSEAAKSAAEAAARELEVMVMEGPPPPPPSFEADRPQVSDLETSIALIRRELVAAEQPEATEAPDEAPAPGVLAESDAGSPAALTPRREALADSAIAEAPVVPVTPSSTIQPRDRRLAKILELYDEGSPELARDALEIFLRDFADDPISQRILGQP